MAPIGSAGSEVSEASVALPPCFFQTPFFAVVGLKGSPGERGGHSTTAEVPSGVFITDSLDFALLRGDLTISGTFSHAPLELLLFVGETGETHPMPGQSSTLSLGGAHSWPLLGEGRDIAGPSMGGVLLALGETGESGSGGRADVGLGEVGLVGEDGREVEGERAGSHGPAGSESDEMLLWVLL